MEKVKKVWDLCGVHLLMVLCGLVLILSPDSAVALVTKLVAWLLVIFGVLRLVGNVTQGTGEGKNWIAGLGALLLGGFLLANPLTISNLIGRALGIFLALQGANDLSRSRQGGGKALAVLTLLAGIVLILLPRTLVNTLLNLTGLVLIVIGAINCLGKLRSGGRLESGDPNIIDADE